MNKYLLACNDRFCFVDMLPKDSGDYYGEVQTKFEKENASNEFSFTFMEKLYPNDTANGIPYKMELCGPQGAYYYLFAFPDVVPGQIKGAKEEIKRKYDAVKIITRRFKKQVDFTMPKRS